MYESRNDEWLHHSRGDHVGRPDHRPYGGRRILRRNHGQPADRICLGQFGRRRTRGLNADIECGDQRHLELRHHSGLDRCELYRTDERARRPDLHRSRLHWHGHDRDLHLTGCDHLGRTDHRTHRRPRQRWHQLLRRDHGDCFDRLLGVHLYPSRSSSRHESGERADQRHGHSVDDNGRRRYYHLCQLNGHHADLLLGDGVQRRGHDGNLHDAHDLHLGVADHRTHRGYRLLRHGHRRSADWLYLCDVEHHWTDERDSPAQCADQRELGGGHDGRFSDSQLYGIV